MLCWELCICYEWVRFKICFKGKSNTIADALEWKSEKRVETRMMRVFDLNSCADIDDIYWDENVGGGDQFGGVKNQEFC